MIRGQKQTTGFTIVELLIVVVVIAILAAITIVAYTGIQDQATVSAVKSELSQAAKSIEAYRFKGNPTESYPTQLSDAGASITGADYYYSALDNSYCITKTKGTTVYHSSSANPEPLDGPCGQDTLLGWYPLNGNANDASGNGVNGVITGATPATGQGGAASTAYNFSGSAQYIQVPSNFGMPVANVTLSAWMYSATATNLGSLLKVGNTGTAYASNGYAIGVGTGSGFSATGSYVGGLYESRRWVMSTSSISSGTWHHIVMTIDSAGTGKIYRDGVRVLDAAGVTPLASAANYSTIGGYLDGSSNSRYFTGRIDDVRIIGRVLTSAEVLGMYAAGAE